MRNHLKLGLSTLGGIRCCINPLYMARMNLANPMACQQYHSCPSRGKEFAAAWVGGGATGGAYLQPSRCGV